MTWSDDVCRNRILVHRASGGGKVAMHRRLPPPAQPPRPNSGLVPIAVVAGLLAGTVAWNKEGHKLRGRQLPSWLEPLRPLLSKLQGSGGGSRPSSGAANAAARQRQQQQQRQAAALAEARRKEEQRVLAAAAAERRFQVGGGSLVGWGVASGTWHTG